MLKDQLHVNIALSLQESVLPAAVSYWGQALRVRRTESRIRLNRKCQQNQVNLSIILILNLIVILATRCFSSRTVSTPTARMLVSRLQCVVRCGCLRNTSRYTNLVRSVFVLNLYLYLYVGA